MRKIAYMIGLLFLCGYGTVWAQNDRAVVDKDGRNIQLDGFLLEWNEEENRRLSPESPVRWDAMNTPEGFAGYVQYPYSPDSCGIRTFLLRQANTGNLIARLTVKVPDPQQDMYSVNLDTDKDSLIAAEWLVPWSKINPDTSGIYTLTLVMDSGCDGISGSVRIQGKTGLFNELQPDETPSSSRLIFQGVLIAVLLAAYLLVRARANKLKKKQG